jgi:hypothetical protein
LIFNLKIKLFLNPVDGQKVGRYLLVTDVKSIKRKGTSMLKSLLTISMLAALSTACDQKEEKQETEEAAPEGTVVGGGSTPSASNFFA